MRFVHQHADAPLIGQRQPVEQGADIEVVVVVADHHISPARHLLAEVVRADIMGQRHLAQRRLIQLRVRQRGLARRWQPVIEAACQRTGLAVTGLVRVFAGLVAGDQLQHAHLVRA
ncbi:hypothetical protein SSTU70S_03029 [Stutzerimonas stutzeri]